MLRLNIILRCFETSSIFFITENRFIQIYTYTTNIKNITNINVEKNFFNFRNFNLKLKYKMRKINEMNIPSYKLEFQIFFETFQKKKKMGQSFCFLRSFVLLRQARAKRIVSFYRARNRRAAFLRRVNGTLCAGYSCHSRVSTYELSHIYVAHSYRERDINTRARCEHVHIHPRCVTTI